MKEYLNENTLYNTLAMYLAETNSLILVVEGPDDHLMLKEHASSDLVLMAGTGGRGQALRAAELSVKRGLKNVRFLVDRDYDDFRDVETIELENVFVSDGHDCFIDVLANDPGLLNRVIDVETASARRRPGASSTIPSPSEIQSEAIALASHLVAVRVLDARRSLGLNFRKFSFGELKIRNTNVQIVTKMVLVRSGYDESNSTQIISEAADVHLEVCGLPVLPVGDHDLFSALARVLKHFKVSVSSDALQRGVILAVSCTALSHTGWFRKVQDWCAHNGRVGFDCMSGNALAA